MPTEVTIIKTEVDMDSIQWVLGDKSHVGSIWLQGVSDVARERIDLIFHVP